MCVGTLSQLMPGTQQVLKSHLLTTLVTTSQQQYWGPGKINTLLETKQNCSWTQSDHVFYPSSSVLDHSCDLMLETTTNFTGYLVISTAKSSSAVAVLWHSTLFWTKWSKCSVFAMSCLPELARSQAASWPCLFSHVPGLQLEHFTRMFGFLILWPTEFLSQPCLSAAGASINNKQECVLKKLWENGPGQAFGHNPQGVDLCLGQFLPICLQYLKHPIM